MKIVCDSCQAKYSIADEKVAGKVFKIKCKRCGSVLSVRGDEQAQAGPPELAGRNYPDEAIWHVVVNGEQHGPYDAAALAGMLGNGTIDWEAFVWSEGFENWLPMRDVQELVSQITNSGGGGGGGGALETIDEVRASASSYMPPSMGADPFADDGASAPSPFDMSGGGGGGPDLFGPSSRSGSFDAPSSPHALPAPQQQMTGQRHENSVLFSLKNLQALATGGSSPGGSPGESPGGPMGMGSPGGFGGAAPGMASGEGSGLIDIRALATATGVGDSRRGERDDLLRIGAHQGGAFGALGSPVLAPVAEEGDSQRKLVIWAGVAAVAFLSIAAVAIVWLLRPQQAPTTQQVVTTVPAAPAPAVGPAAPVAPAPVLPPSEGELAAKAALAAGETPKPAEAASAAPRPGGGAARRPATGGGGGAQRPATSDPMEREPAAPATKKPAGGPRTLDDLLEGALAGKSEPQRQGAAPAGDSSLPDQPSRTDVMNAMNGVKSGVASCAQGQGGVAIVSVTVAGSTGRVTGAQVEGITGPAGSCIAREARAAKFPRFKQPTFKVKYPYRL